jgi:hypothetical protein
LTTPQTTQYDHEFNKSQPVVAKINSYSSFQTFALLWMLHAFFWVIPRRLNFIYRRFVTLFIGGCLFSTYALQPSRLIVRSGLDVPTFATRRVTTREHQAAEGGTVGEKCPRILPKIAVST